MPLSISEPGVQNITIREDRTFYLRCRAKLDGVPLPLTGKTVRMQLKEDPDAEDILVSLSSDDPDQIVKGTSPEWWIDIRIGTDLLEDLEAPLAGFYDIALYDDLDPTETTPVLEGEFEYLDTVTRDG